MNKLAQLIYVHVDLGDSTVEKAITVTNALFTKSTTTPSDKEAHSPVIKRQMPTKGSNAKTVNFQQEKFNQSVKPVKYQV